MSKYEVRVTATFNKTYSVEAECEELAVEKAVDAFEQDKDNFDLDNDFSDFDFVPQEVTETSFLGNAGKLNDFQTLPKDEFMGKYGFSEADYTKAVKDYEELDEILWTAACNGKTSVIEDYFEHDGVPNIRHFAFGGKHSLIMGALRNRNFDTVRVLAGNGETIEPHEQEEYNMLYDEAKMGSKVFPKKASANEEKGTTVYALGIKGGGNQYCYAQPFDYDSEKRIYRFVSDPKRAALFTDKKVARDRLSQMPRSISELVYLCTLVSESDGTIRLVGAEF